MTELIHLRPAQKEILGYQGGKMGIIAVPGSGKTFTLSLLAARIIADDCIAEDQEVLVVTLVNAAVDNFEQQINAHLRRMGLMPDFGFRVRTLHGLAHDIVRERPDLAGLSEDFIIVDERDSRAILRDVTTAWLKGNEEVLLQFINPELAPEEVHRLFSKNLPFLMEDVALACVRTLKDMRITPWLLERMLERQLVDLPLARMGLEIYSQYQSALRYRGGVDFDDLILSAIEVLESDETYLQRLRSRWPYILEDEAQDSSRLQEEILRLLCGQDGNWVRVGDVNQAIYETFTTANPKFLTSFINEEGVQRHQLPESGRSMQSIIDLANYLVNWTINKHPLIEARQAFIAPPYIQPTSDDDPQPNPIDQPAGIRLIEKGFTPSEECQWVANSIAEWLPHHPESTVAALVPRNQRGEELVEALQKLNVNPVDMLRSSSTTRAVADDLEKVLRYLAFPAREAYFLDVYRIWKRCHSEDQAELLSKEVLRLLKGLKNLEEFIWPFGERDWLNKIAREGNGSPEMIEELEEFRKTLQQWHQAALLPIDQLILTVAHDLFMKTEEMALVHKFASLLKQSVQLHPERKMLDFAQELKLIASNQQRFGGLGGWEKGFDPEEFRGKVVVTTMHKAKGLEWDRVYLLSINNYDFPSGDAFDEYYEEKWFFLSDFNLQAESLAQLKAALSPGEYQAYQMGEASYQARVDLIRERLRLLYVGVTRARRELILTWNTGRNGTQRMARPLMSLLSFWEKRNVETR